ncbi:citrate synthase [candidate division KSB1 bacterium]|nr:citrate synthase [candidate division KSB1 bacterium]
MTAKQNKVVVRGLEGIVAAETSISYVDGVNGNLYYQGYNIHDFAEKTTFAEVVQLLWTGELPNKNTTINFQSEIVSDMRLPGQVVEMLRLTPPSSHPMAVLRTAISMLSAIDPDANNISLKSNQRKAKRLLAQIPTIIADLHRIRNNAPLISPDPNFNISTNFLYMLRGTPPTKLEQKAMDRLMILHADHGLNASTFTARVITSTLGDMHSAICGAIGALKGPLHGGANQRVMEMLLDIGNLKAVKEYVAGMLENKQRIMGFGHRVYRVEDPRAKHLRVFSEKLCEGTDQQHFFEISHRIENIVKKEKGIFPNVDFYSATVQHALGIPPEYFTTIFAASRAAGWIAHIMEQYADNRLIRPTSKYLGKLGRKFTPFKNRE